MIGTVDTVETGHRARQCDACDAPARVAFVLTSGGGMAFCERHARRYYDTLRPTAVVIEPLR